MNINIQDVRDNPTLPWNRYGLSYNRGLTINDILYLQLPNATRDWNWHIISSYASIQEVRDNPHLPWDRDGLSNNKNLTLYDIENLQLPNATEYKYIDDDDDDYVPILEDPDISIDGLIARYMSGTIDDWDWYHISKNINIQEVRLHPHLPWNRYGLSMNIGLTVRDIEYISIGKHDHLTRDIVPYKIVDKLYDIVFPF